MLLFRRHLISVVVLAAMLFTTPSFVAEFMYCVEMFQLQDGSTCTMAMAESATNPRQGEKEITNSDDCCVVKIVEISNQIVAPSKERDSKEKQFPILFHLSFLPARITRFALVNLHGFPHTNSPPLAQLVVQSSVLLI